ncbi:hypothetical protein Z517_08176 [Fonsecaea pedrosoi CBS 271.37]|uniref:6-methylsalicylate decarboxylase n=1 Tax=Fonsecaea pedrosoi CBS 271.37 TaxID=1442368 RepID=A0A0D2DKY7_9EURO|nr:uncharacterized protein Z517_08176 [Fonsecaea pedrosoi CBS 271.37]KIW78341.1 hypothetical protein Z517_08176 [Fonsecaea pedrosoi CBS 271.37]
MERIDVHNHVVPENYVRLLKELGDPNGSHVPEWSVALLRTFMKDHDVRRALLTLSAPGTTITKGAQSVEFAREVNEALAQIRDSDPDSFGFFASIPPLTQKDDALAEIRYALDTLQADGVIFFTRYGNDSHYLGHPDFAEIWDELDKRHAVAFIHPTGGLNVEPAGRGLSVAVVDFPHETTRTALDLIVSNTVRNHPNVKIILPHAGGTLPYIIQRPAIVLPGFGVPKSSEEIVEDARAFYYDTALSTGSDTLKLLTSFAKPDHILYGSDFPYAPRGVAKHFNNQLDAFQGPEENTLRNINHDNALKLFPRFAKST